MSRAFALCTLHGNRFDSINHGHNFIYYTVSALIINHGITRYVFGGALSGARHSANPKPARTQTAVYTARATQLGAGCSRGWLEGGVVVLVWAAAGRHLPVRHVPVRVSPPRALWPPPVGAGTGVASGTTGGAAGMASGWQWRQRPLRTSFGMVNGRLVKRT